MKRVELADDIYDIAIFCVYNLLVVETHKWGDKIRCYYKTYRTEQFR